MSELETSKASIPSPATKRQCATCVASIPAGEGSSLLCTMDVPQVVVSQWVVTPKQAQVMPAGGFRGSAASQTVTVHVHEAAAYTSRFPSLAPSACCRRWEEKPKDEVKPGLIGLPGGQNVNEIN